MKLVVFSDIHGNLFALKEFFKKIQKIDYDILIFCGDIFGYYYDQKEIIEILREQENLIWIKGNHDVFFEKIYFEGESPINYILQYGHSYEKLKEKINEEEALFVKNLPLKCSFKEYGKRIGIFHGTPDDFLEGRLYPNTNIENYKFYKDYDIVVLGHTHHRMIKRVGKTLIVNSGSLGQPRDGNGYSFCIIDTFTENVKYFEVIINEKKLYEQIDKYDPNLLKLKTVLERGK